MNTCPAATGLSVIPSSGISIEVRLELLVTLKLPVSSEQLSGSIRTLVSTCLKGNSSNVVVLWDAQFGYSSYSALKTTS